jgi:hypothetical protein
MKNIKIKLFFSVIAILLLIVCNIGILGKEHVNVVVENNELREENSNLKNENSKLKSDLLEKPKTDVIDSLKEAITKSDSIIEIKQDSIKKLENKLKNEKLNSIANPYNSTNYSFSAVSGAENN